jgi:hypothetical protein
MTSTIATAVAWQANTTTPPPGWDRLTDTDGIQSTGWFTTTNGAFRTAVRGYPTWDDAPWDIPADLRFHDEDDDYSFLQHESDMVSTTYVFPDLNTAAGPSTHGFGNLDFVGGRPHPLGMTPDGMPENQSLLARILSGAKPTGLLVGADDDVEAWASTAQAAGLEALSTADTTPGCGSHPATSATA